MPTLARMIPRLPLAAAAALLLLPLAGLPARAVDGPPSVITVDGEASAEVAPDMATLSLGVEAERPTAGAATADAAAAAQAVLAALKADDVPDADVLTTAIALDPVYPDNGSNADRMPRAFRAATMFRVKVHPAERAGLVASHLVDKGANTIEGIAYGSSQEARRLDDLRGEAMRDALHKASLYASALNLHLGRVLEITPTGSGARPPMPMMRSASILAATASLPSSPGLLTLQTSVTVRWALEP